MSHSCIFKEEDKPKDEKTKKDIYISHCDKLRNKVKGNYAYKIFIFHTMTNLKIN